MKKTPFIYLAIAVLISFHVMADNTTVSQTQIMARQSPQETVQNTKTSIPDIKGNPIVLSWDEFKTHEEKQFQKWMDKLDLTDKQRLSAKQIHDTETTELTPLVKQLNETQEKIKTVKEKNRQQYESILTDDQIKKWHKKEHKNKHEKSMKKQHKKDKKHWWNFDEN